MADISLHLPSIFPTDGPITTSEEIRYNTFVTDDSNVNDGIVEETEYTLNKAPVTSITEVTGISNGKSVSFEESIDYKLSDDLSSIVWLENSDSTRPDAGTLFTVSYRSESILNRYITAGEQELELVENSMSLTRQKKVIDSATGEELDRIGELFGVLGDRGDRDDIEYRTFLKSIVKSFISRGTNDDIITALSAATDVPPEDITINENFIKNEYEVEILAQTAVRGSIIEDVTEIADPSGVDLSTTRFVIPKDEIEFEDNSNFKFGNKIIDSLNSKDNRIIDGNLIILSDDLLSSDVIESPRRNATDIINSNEIILLNNNNILQIDDLLSTDRITSARKSSLEETEFDENITNVNRDKNSFRWRQNISTDTETDWNFFEWTEIINISTPVQTEGIVFNENTSIILFDSEVSDLLVSNDSIDEDASEKILSEQNVTDVIDDDASEKILSEQNVTDVIDEDASEKILDVDNSKDVIDVESRNNNQQRWNDHRWNLFNWTEIIDLGVFRSSDLSIVTDKFGFSLGRSFNDNVVSSDSLSTSVNIAIWGETWDDMFWTVDDDSDSFDFSDNQWTEQSWDSFVWTPQNRNI